MTERVTNKQLENLVERLNSYSKCKYVLEHSYGRQRVIMKHPNSAGCISDVTYNLPKGELESVLSGILSYLERESNPKNHISTCEHIDKLNGEPFRGVLHEHDGKKLCSACGEVKSKWEENSAYIRDSLRDEANAFFMLANELDERNDLKRLELTLKIKEMALVKGLLTKKEIDEYLAELRN